MQIQRAARMLPQSPDMLHEFDDALRCLLGEILHVAVKPPRS